MTTPTTAAAHNAGETQRRTLWPGVAGIASGVLLLVSLLVVLAVSPDVRGREGLRETFLFYLDQGNLDLSVAMATVQLVAAVLFVWFLAALARLAGNRSHLVLGSGVAFTVLLLVAALTGSVFALSVNSTEVVRVTLPTTVIAILLLDMAYAAYIAAMAVAAVLLFTVWRVSVTTGAVPVWLGWFGFAVAVASLAGPYTAWLTAPLMAVWILLAGLLLVLRPPATAMAEPPGAGPAAAGTPGARASDAGPPRGEPPLP
ncbi:hypothetical protein I3F58_07950 [Streptomyces sp. MUM 203J]|uniref:hypothetical protein n=1 Tax=Streptomyces sp. MUM 203J TaxID=2791990 RepID=UPI001F03E216|nr:hypothetical protein [Streptomyces sp. MUM 203J]MCH0539498.1 hypothetical protein [Streptomyces sp. MUM 203J]